MRMSLMERLSVINNKLLPLVRGPNAPRLWLIVLWYACLTYGTVYALHFWMWSEGTSQSITDMLSTHERVVSQVDIAPIQYRYAAYALPEFLHRALGVSVSASYGLVRLVFTLLSVLLFHWYLSKWFDWQLSVIGVLTFLASVPLLTTHKDLQPTDMPSLAFLLMAFVALQRRQPWWLLITAPMATLFRETAFYQLILWAAMIVGTKVRRTELVLFVIATGLTLAVYVGLHAYFGYRPYAYELISIWGNLRRGDTFVESFLAFNIFWFISWLGIRNAPAFMRRALALAPVIFITIWVLGNPAESRLWFPLFPVLIPLGLLVLSNGKQTLAPSTAS